MRGWLRWCPDRPRRRAPAARPSCPPATTPAGRCSGATSPAVPWDCHCCHCCCLEHWCFAAVAAGQAVGLVWSLCCSVPAPAAGLHPCTGEPQHQPAAAAQDSSGAAADGPRGAAQTHTAVRQLSRQELVPRGRLGLHQLLQHLALQVQEPVLHWGLLLSLQASRVRVCSCNRRCRSPSFANARTTLWCCTSLHSPNQKSGTPGGAALVLTCLSCSHQPASWRQDHLGTRLAGGRRGLPV